MNWKMLRVLAVMSLVVVGVITLLVVGKPLNHNLVVKAYFKDGMGLREGAKVRLAGIDIGTVKSVRLRPEAKEAPVEVVMVLASSYELKIPNDSIASLATAGLLGEAYVQVDASRASGPRLESHGVLKTVPTVELSTQEMIEKLSGVVAKGCECPPVSSVSKKLSTKSSQTPLSPNPKR